MPETQHFQLLPGRAVIRVASEKDYTNGRKGEILEINTQTERVRVLWKEESTGHKIKVRTWVKFSALKLDNG